MIKRIKGLAEKERTLKLFSNMFRLNRYLFFMLASIFRSSEFITPIN